MSARTHVSGIATIHTRMKAREQDSKSPHLALFSSLVGDLIPKGNAIANKEDFPDPTLNSSANFLKLHGDVKQFRSAATTMTNRASSLHRDAVADIEQQENARLGFNKGNPDRVAIIAKFSTLSQADQVKQLGVWMKDATNGGALLGIVIGADPFLTGVTPETAARFRSDFVKAHAPDLVNDRDTLNEALEAVLAVNRAVELIAGDLSDERRYAEIQRQKEAHDAAGAVLAAGQA